MPQPEITQSAPWQALLGEAQRVHEISTRSMFDHEPDRCTYLCMAAASIEVDFSKNQLDKMIFEKLLKLADYRDIAGAIRALFSGDIVNPTENRPALHTLLRSPQDAPVDDANRTKLEQSLEVRRQIDYLSTQIRDGEFLGFDGKAIRDVVNIGIGGSHLGPQTVCEALCDDVTGDVNVHFVSNVDGGDIERVLSEIDPATSLFIIASKSFTTAETLLNASTASAWIEAHFGTREAIARHFVAVSARPDRARNFGIAEDHILPMWDWVGGRFSLWSAIGLPIAIAIGNDAFTALLAGAHAMDRHVSDAPLRKNIAVIQALIGVWNTNFLGHDSHAVIPYDERLRYLPEYLQQLEMESNGKRVGVTGVALDHDTAPVLWGGIGTNVQHAFFQLLHQGTRKTSVDFIIALHHENGSLAHQDMLVANCLAQAEGLMLGRNDADADTDPSLRTHKECPGNRPSTLFSVDALNPKTLGALLALYEHKTYIQGALWGINPFDQWGVEIGKSLAESILAEIRIGTSGEHDASTARVMQRYIDSRSQD